MDQRTSPEYFETLVDPVEFSALIPYEDGRKWVFVQDVDLTLGEVAHAFSTGNKAKIETWFNEEKIKVFSSVHSLNHYSWFTCIYFEDLYFLKPMLIRNWF